MYPDWPASLSPEICRKLLRDDVGYKGLVLTDDLDMGAIIKHFDFPVVMRRVLAAGIDLALICHESPRIAEAFELIRNEIRTDEKAKADALASIGRILYTKQRFLA